jgi:coenzyme F420 hydrogenase subunit beta
MPVLRFIRSPKTLSDVVEWGLCIGCGGCAAADRSGGTRMVHVEAEGFRPVFDTAASAANPDGLAVCPGARVNGNLEIGHLPKRTEADHEFGPVLEIWEGWATDPHVRFKGSSGGVLSALSLYSVEQGGFAGIVHAGMDAETPWMNRNYVSRNRAEILARAGSRYAPSAPCAALGTLEAGPAPYVFVGKPCDAAAVSELRRRDADIQAKVGVVLTFFCAGTPSTRGTLDLLRSLHAGPDRVAQVHYRGEGWPGRFRVITETGTTSKSLSYNESWSRLTGYRPLRCNLCPDGLGRVSDIACGDAWDQFEENGDPGRSLILVRTERGRRLLAAARQAGYVTLRPAAAANVMRAQRNLLERRRTLFGRLAAFRLLGVPMPTYEGFSLFRSWLRLGPSGHSKSIGGTLHRIIRKGWYRRRTAGVHAL